MKKLYIQPATELVVLSEVNTLMAGSIEGRLSNELYDGAAGSRASASEYDIWDFDDEEE